MKIRQRMKIVKRWCIANSIKPVYVIEYAFPGKKKAQIIHQIKQRYDELVDAYAEQTFWADYVEGK